MACYVGKTSFVELLLARGVDVNATVYLNGSAIQAAALAGQISIIRLLLQAGANINNARGL
jgi:ankyrin repeat protein